MARLAATPGTNDSGSSVRTPEEFLEEPKTHYRYNLYREPIVTPVSEAVKTFFQRFLTDLKPAVVSRSRAVTRVCMRLANYRDGTDRIRRGKILFSCNKVRFPGV